MKTSRIGHAPGNWYIHLIRKFKRDDDNTKILQLKKKKDMQTFALLLAQLIPTRSKLSFKITITKDQLINNVDRNQDLCATKLCSK